MPVKHLPVDSIRIDGGTQVRADINKWHVESYTEVWQEGGEFPPLIVYYDGDAYWLADGFHTLQAFFDESGDVIFGLASQFIVFLELKRPFVDMLH